MDAPGVAVQLHEGAEGAVVTGVKGGPCYGTDAESIMRQQLGWDVPVKDLRAWVLGLRAPGEEAQVHLGANQLPDQLTQDGWVVSYRSWYTDRSPPLPKIVFAEKYPYKIRLSITSWTVR
jgi:outer membrane lipoprotein LolB